MWSCWRPSQRGLGLWAYCVMGPYGPSTVEPGGPTTQAHPLFIGRHIQPGNTAGLVVLKHHGGADRGQYSRELFLSVPGDLKSGRNGDGAQPMGGDGARGDAALRLAADVCLHMLASP